MPLNVIAKIYRKRIIGNPWLYHAGWWVKDVAADGKVRTKIEVANFKNAVVALARVVPLTARSVLDVARNKF